MSGFLLREFPRPQTLVLLTGDGNGNGGRQSFAEVVQQALLRSNVNVEVWCWKKACSRRYLDFERSYSSTGRFSLIYLDAYLTDLCGVTGKCAAVVPTGGGHSCREGGSHGGRGGSRSRSGSGGRAGRDGKGGRSGGSGSGSSLPLSSSKPLSLPAHSSTSNHGHASSSTAHPGLPRKRQRVGGGAQAAPREANSVRAPPVPAPAPRLPVQPLAPRPLAPMALYQGHGQPPPGLRSANEASPGLFGLVTASGPPGFGFTSAPSLITGNLPLGPPLHYYQHVGLRHRHPPPPLPLPLPLHRTQHPTWLPAP